MAICLKWAIALQMNQHETLKYPGIISWLQSIPQTIPQSVDWQ
ncbi:hypothetical protein [Nostoc sp.]